MNKGTLFSCTKRAACHWMTLRWLPASTGKRPKAVFVMRMQNCVHRCTTLSRPKTRSNGIPMSENDDKFHETDPGVSATYREMARETVPTDVDAAVLRQARQAVESRSGIARLTGWLRPLTFVATAGLSLALIVQLSNTPDYRIPDHLDPTVAPLPADVFQDAADQTAEQIRRLGEDPGMSAPPDSRQWWKPLPRHRCCQPGKGVTTRREPAPERGGNAFASWSKGACPKLPNESCRHF